MRAASAVPSHACTAAPHPLGTDDAEQSPGCQVNDSRRKESLSAHGTHAETLHAFILTSVCLLMHIYMVCAWSGLGRLAEVQVERQEERGTQQVSAAARGATLRE